MNPSEYMECGEEKHAENWPDSLREIVILSRPLCQMLGMKSQAFPQRYVRSLVESRPRRMRSIVEEQVFQITY
jgi:hypothetical protein